MARSSNLSEGMRDFAEQGAEQARRMADLGTFGMRDFAEHSVGQARQAFDGFLSATHRSLTSFDQQASERRTTRVIRHMRNIVRAAPKLERRYARFVCRRLRPPATHSKWGSVWRSRPGISPEGRQRAKGPR